MAEAQALVEIVLEQFVSIIRQQAEEGINLIAGAEQEVEKLQSNFLSIQALLADAENRQVKENAVRVWLDKLKDTSYDIDDVLDEWNTELQKLKIKKAEYASNPLKKGMKSVKRVGNEFLGIESDATSSSSSIIAFPKLKFLCFRWMEEWEEWNYGSTKRGDEDIPVMPSLQTLKLEFCLKLKSLPNHLSQMTKLKKEIRFCPLLQRTENP